MHGSSCNRPSGDRTFRTRVRRCSGMAARAQTRFPLGIIQNGGLVLPGDER
jgi:hypothetical protein